MAGQAPDRRLAAVLSADAVGYSRLMSQDDEATVRTLGAHRRRIERLLDTFRGRLVDSPGDNLLAELPSAAAAVRCAVEIQRALAAENDKLEAERRMPFRIGIHLGDVLVEGERIYGEGVNVAARLEALAEPGAICVSDLVYQQVRRKLELPVTDLGEQTLKNIETPVRAHQILGEAPEGPPSPRAAAPAKLEPPAAPSLAVLPFVNLNRERAQDYFADGIFEDVMTELARIPGLFVISSDSMITYKDTNATPGHVARELGVRHVLEGAVRYERRRARISARLVEGATGRVVWSERYDCELEDVFAVQDEIVHDVVTELDVALLSGADARTSRAHLRDPRALALLYRGTDLMMRFNREDLREARHLFEEVIRIAPECPFGYTNAAFTHFFELQRGWSRDPEASLARMAELVDCALERGDVSGYPSLIRGHLHLVRREHEEALEIAERAVAERPSCQFAYSLKANILNYCGRAEEAIPLAKHAIRLTPVAPSFYPEVLAAAYYLCGRLEEAITHAHETLRLAPDSIDARVLLAAALGETGRREAAEAVARELLALEPGFSARRFLASQPYRDASVRKRLLRSMREAGLPPGDEASEAPAYPTAPSRQRLAPRPRF